VITYRHQHRAQCPNQNTFEIHAAILSIYPAVLSVIFKPNRHIAGIECA
jgi:hypothetical protein